MLYSLFHVHQMKMLISGKKKQLSLVNIIKNKIKKIISKKTKKKNVQ